MPRPDDRLPRPTPRSEFRAALRAQLLREGPSALVPARRTRMWWRPLATAAATVTLVVSANAAAGQSLPGEAPFVIKRTAEEVRLLFAFDEPARVEILVDQAQARLAEVRRATAQLRPAAAAEASTGLAQALGRLADEVEKVKRAIPQAGNEEKAVGKAEKVATEQADAIEKLLPAAAASAKVSLERASEETRKIRSTPSPRPSPRPSRTPERTPERSGGSSGSGR